jgi:hypothetical protein
MRTLATLGLCLLLAPSALAADPPKAPAAKPEAAKPEAPVTPMSEAAAAKLFARAKDAFGRNRFVEAAALCWRFIQRNKPGVEKFESAQFFLANSLEKLGFIHGAVEYYYQVANNRQSPELLPRALRQLEAISLAHPFDEGMVLRDLLGDTDFGELPGDLSDFAYYWQAMTNLERKLEGWSTERFLKVSRKGYYYYSALYVSSIRLLASHKGEARKEALTGFAELFGALDLGSALDSLRRRGEADSKLAYALRALITDEGVIQLRTDKLPKGWEVELAMLGLARVAAETDALLTRAKETDEEALGLPLAYSVAIGGMPIYTRAIPFEDRGPSIRAVASRYAAVRAIRGKALHSLSRLLYEQKQYAAAYTTLGAIPKNTELSSEILLERAWSKYRSGDPHRAMGLLYALDAPVYKALFAPEKFVLRGLIYRRFCHFRAAKLAARKFRIDYAKTLRAIREGEPLEEIDKVREAALRRAPALKLHLFVRSLRNERAALDKHEDEWKGGKGLRMHLRHLYLQKLEQSKADLGRALEVSAREVAEDMLDAEEQVNLLEYEVGQAIFQRLSESASLSQARKRAARVPVSSERVYYKFGGEYWTDELPSYKFNIEDRCVD